MIHTPIFQRITVVGLFAICVSAVSLASASAQDWPSRSISVVVPLGAGSASDLVARVVMEQVGKQLGQTVVVENRPAPAGRSAPIRSPSLHRTATRSLSMARYPPRTRSTRNCPTTLSADFTPVSSLGQQPLVIIAPPSKGYKTLGDLIAAGKAKPGSLNYTSGRRFGLAFRRRAAALQRGFRGSAHSVQGRRRSGDGGGFGSR